MAICVIAVVGRGVVPMPLVRRKPDHLAGTQLRLLLETSRRRSRATAGLGCRAVRQSASAQSPAFAERGAITDLGRQASAVLIHLYPERVGFVESDRVAVGVAWGKHVHRFTCREHMAAYV